MKLLFDQNLSPTLVDRLTDLFPGSSHVFYCGLDKSSDRDVRLYAEVNDFVIVTKDSDYCDLALLFGYPPKIIWIRRGNCKTRDIEQMLRDNYRKLQHMNADSDAAMITIY